MTCYLYHANNECSEKVWLHKEPQPLQLLQHQSAAFQLEYFMWFYAQHMQQMANYTLKVPAPSSTSLLKLASVQHRNCKIFPTHLSPMRTPKRQKHPKSMDIKSRFKHKMKESSCCIDSNSIQTAMITRMTPIWPEAQIHHALTSVSQRHMATQSLTDFASSYCQPSETHMHAAFTGFPLCCFETVGDHKRMLSGHFMLAVCLRLHVH